MLIEHSKDLAGLFSTRRSDYRRDYSPTQYDVNYQSVECPQLDGISLRLGYDYASKAYSLNWHQSVDTFASMRDVEAKVTVIPLVKVKEHTEPSCEPWVVDFAANSTFPFSPRGTLYSPEMPYEIWARVSIVIRDRNDSVPLKQFASTATASFLARESRNVCFYFPRSRRRLWANEDVLRKASPYFETLFSSDFAEGTPSTPPRDEDVEQDFPPYTYADSDVDFDELRSDDPSKTEADLKGFDVFPFKTIRVVDTSFSTYLAVLLWISTRFITFAPLSSSFITESDPDGADTARSARRAALVLSKKANAESESGLPKAVSPKSVYRLAHLLELADLAALALANYESHLTPSGAFYELYGDEASVYPEMQAIAMKYVVDHWDEVRRTKSVQVVEARAEAGLATSTMAAIGIKLAKRLTEKR